MNEKGDTTASAGETFPLPSCDIVTCEALPPNVFPDTVIGVTPHVVPLVLDIVRVGHCPQSFTDINKKEETKNKALDIFCIYNP